MSAGPEIAERRRILVVDDVELNRLLTEAVLRGATYDVHSVCDGDAAIAALEGQRFDLVIMDLDMPSRSGYDAAAVIRRGDSESVKLIALSARGDAMSRLRSQEVRMSAHIARPIAPSDLLREIECVLTLPAAVQRQDPWDYCLYEDWVDRLGADRMRFFLIKLRDQLRELRLLSTQPGPSGREAVHRMAHDVSSTSGMLGFTDVTRTCRLLLEADSIAAEARARPALRDALERAVQRLDQYLAANEPRAAA